ncbi:MAG: Rieske (2Fe-2S) protein, partial [Chloroflexota bacterium]
MGGDLTKGKFDGRIVTCPRHGAQYDVTTGELVKDVGLAAKAINLGKGAVGQATYSVTVDGDDVILTT